MRTSILVNLTPCLLVITIAVDLMRTALSITSILLLVRNLVLVPISRENSMMTL